MNTGWQLGKTSNIVRWRNGNARCSKREVYIPYLNCQFESGPDYHILSYLQSWLASAGHFCFKACQHKGSILTFRPQSQGSIIKKAHLDLGNVLKKGPQGAGNVLYSDLQYQGSILKSDLGGFLCDS